jgi:hypothetical protein
MIIIIMSIVLSFSEFIKENLENSVESNRYVVFVCGTNTTGISHDSQYKTFDAGLAAAGGLPEGITLKKFDYDSNVKRQNDGTKKIKVGSKLDLFLKENPSNIEAFILFSAGCYYVNDLCNRKYSKDIIYCIEPYSSPNGKKNWTMLDPSHFWVHPSSSSRGFNADVHGERKKSEIPKENKTADGVGHSGALQNAIPNIAKVWNVGKDDTSSTQTIEEQLRIRPKGDTAPTALTQDEKLNICLENLKYIEQSIQKIKNEIKCKKNSVAESTTAVQGIGIRPKPEPGISSATEVLTLVDSMCTRTNALKDSVKDFIDKDFLGKTNWCK